MSDSDGERLWFGKKYRGCKWADVPTPYLRWMLFSCDNLAVELREKAKEALVRRQDRFVPAAEVMADLEETLMTKVATDDAIEFETCAKVGDHVLLTFEEVRQRFGFGDGAQLMIDGKAGPDTQPSDN